jgi:flagellar basal-body rod modification protein FlgD
MVNAIDSSTAGLSVKSINNHSLSNTQIKNVEMRNDMYNKSIENKPNAGSKAVLQQADFLKLLTAELKYQDPTKPMDNREFIAQMAQFSSLNETSAMNSKMGELVDSISKLHAIGLVGSEVEYVQPKTGYVSSGKVEAINLANGQVEIAIEGSDKPVPYTSITTVGSKDNNN